MDFDGVNSVVCDAEESDWLDVSYSERNYVEEQPPKRAAKKFNFKLVWNKPLKIAAIALVCLALLAALLFADGKFAKDVFETARMAYSSSVFSPAEQPIAATVAIPANLDLVGVDNGVATFTGGRAVLSLTSGTVVSVDDNSLTVATDDSTNVVYGNVSEVFAAVGDVVSANGLLARYSDSFTVAITVDGVVADVVASETQLTWNV